MAQDKCAAIATATPRWFGYALQSLIYLAYHSCSAVRCPSGEIAHQVSTEPTMMRRILAKLARAGIVEAREGRDGGYYLRKPPESITLADVYRALEMNEPLCTGMMESAADGPVGAEVKDAFSTLRNEAEQMLMALFEKRTVGDLVQEVYGGEKK